MSINNNNNLPAVVNLNYNGFTIRNVKDNDGKIWFVAKDIVAKLGYSEESIATPGKLFGAVPEIWKGRKRIPTPGGEQDMLCVTENGAYFFLARSDKPGALDFQMWLAGEVVPSIMHTGEYVHPAVKQAREQNTKPAVRTEPKSYMSKARFNATTRIISLALDCKEEKDFQKVIALDNAFRARSGYSALEDAGFSLSTVKHSRDVEDLDPAFIWRDSRKRIHRTEYYYTFEWKHNLPVLPTSYRAD